MLSSIILHVIRSHTFLKQTWLKAGNQAQCIQMQSKLYTAAALHTLSKKLWYMFSFSFLHNVKYVLCFLLANYHYLQLYTGICNLFNIDFAALAPSDLCQRTRWQPAFSSHKHPF